jgi:hypothetical protein
MNEPAAEIQACTPFVIQACTPFVKHTESSRDINVVNGLAECPNKPPEQEENQ